MTHERERDVDHVFLRKAVGWITGAREEGALKALLVDLGGYLETHFTAEERTGGFFDQVVGAAPHHAPTIDELRSQHRAMLASTVGLASELGDLPGAASPEVLGRVASLVRDLEQHEGRELALLQSLDRDLGHGH